VKDNYDFLAKITGTTRKDISVWLAQRRHKAKTKTFTKPVLNSANQKLILETAWEMNMLLPSDHQYYDQLGEFTTKGRKGITIWAAYRRFKAKNKRKKQKSKKRKHSGDSKSKSSRKRIKKEIPIIPMKMELPSIPPPTIPLNIPPLEREFYEFSW